MQFTPDLLPSDVVGVTRVEPQRRASSSSGPARSSPTSCSATRSTGPRRRRSRRCSRPWPRARSPSTATTYPLGPPFMVIATQNPIEHEGTYPAAREPARPVPHAGVGRLPRPRRRDRRARHPRRPRPRSTTSARWPPPPTSRRMIAAAARRARGPGAQGLPGRPGRRHPPPPAPRARHVAARHAQPPAGGPGPGRGRTAAAYVIPDDIKALAEPVLAHRLLVTPEAQLQGISSADVLAEVLRRGPGARPCRRREDAGMLTRQGWLSRRWRPSSLFIAGRLVRRARAVRARRRDRRCSSPAPRCT